MQTLSWATMKYAHMADLHIGGWQEDTLREVNMESFRKAIEICISEKVDFILFAGDIFNTSIPQIDLIKETTAILKKLKDYGIPVYCIPGSHDFSPSGKTMLEVLEKAGLLVSVFKFKDNRLLFTADPKTGVKITGILGRKSGLEKNDYEMLDLKSLESEPGYKIFMFHTAIEEFKPKDYGEVELIGLDVLPKNFNYYAGGHVHYILKKDYGNGILTYPGALYPNNFKELEEFKHGGFYIIENETMRRIELPLKGVVPLRFDVGDKSANEATAMIIKELSIHDVRDKIILLRVYGSLKSGKPSDVNFKEIFNLLKDSYCVLKNTAKLSSSEFMEIKAELGESVNDVEQKVVQQALGSLKLLDLPIDEEEKLVLSLIKALDLEKAEGEKVADFEKRVISESVGTLNLSL